MLILGLAGGGFLVVLILISVSFASLEYTEYGLDYASIAMSISPQPYTGGLYFLGLGHSFIKFPKTIQTIEYSNDNGADLGPIRSRTSDGLEVILEISFQYELIPEKLYDLYMEFESQYRTIILNVAVDTLTDKATKYTAYNFFSDRARIGNEMQMALNTMLISRTFCSVEFFQLRSVDLPDAFENAIQTTEVKRQNIQKARAEQNKIQVEIETQIMKAVLNKEVIVNLAEGEAQATIERNQGEVKAFNATAMAAIEGYAWVKKESGLDNTGLMAYIRAELVKGYDGSKLVISV